MFALGDVAGPAAVQGPEAAGNAFPNTAQARLGPQQIWGPRACLRALHVRRRSLALYQGLVPIHTYI